MSSPAAIAALASLHSPGRMTVPGGLATARSASPILARSATPAFSMASAIRNVAS
jgi:hypothetical protein